MRVRAFGAIVAGNRPGDQPNRTALMWVRERRCSHGEDRSQRGRRLSAQLIWTGHGEPTRRSSRTVARDPDSDSTRDGSGRASPQAAAPALREQVAMSNVSAGDTVCDRVVDDERLVLRAVADGSAEAEHAHRRSGDILDRCFPDTSRRS